MNIEAMLSDTHVWPTSALHAVGKALIDARTIQPGDGDTYDEQVGITFKPIDVMVDGVRIRAAPRRIGVREVARHAKASCRRCHGIGWHAARRMVEVGRDDRGHKHMEEMVFEQTCGCAERRYKEEFRRFVIDQRLGEWIALDELEITHVE